MDILSEQQNTKSEKLGRETKFYRCLGPDRKGGISETWKRFSLGKEWVR